MFSKISGFNVIFGGRWDDIQGKAGYKTEVRGTVGFYDQSKLPKGDIYPAVSVIYSLLRLMDERDTHEIFFTSDTEDVFASIVGTGGLIAPFSETIYRSRNEWLNAIYARVLDKNIDRIYVPFGIEVQSQERLTFYKAEKALDASTFSPLVVVSKKAAILGGVAITAIISAIFGGLAIFILDPFAAEPPPPMTKEVKYLLDNTKMLEQCQKDLADAWPTSPEWSLEEEGCVLQPANYQTNSLKPEDMRPYAFRKYVITGADFDPLLSDLAFRKLSERFPGQILSSDGKIMLYMGFDTIRKDMPESFFPEQNPKVLIDRAFVGSINYQNQSAMTGLEAATAVEMNTAIKRIKDLSLSPVAITRADSGSMTKMLILPETEQSETVVIDPSEAGIAQETSGE